MIKLLNHLYDDYYYSFHYLKYQEKHCKPNLARLNTVFKESSTVTLHLLSDMTFLPLPVNVTLLIRRLKVSELSRMKHRKKKCAKLPKMYQPLH